VSLDRQSIEKRDFPISRRGYDPVAVDAHLRGLAGEVDDLQRSASSRGGESLGSAAGTQVQSILEAAEATAAEIERQATDNAREAREHAAADAEQTRSDAVRRAQEHVAAVSQATAILLQRVESMDSESSALIQSLRAGAARLASDLALVETNMGELYDSASGGVSTPSATRAAAAPAPAEQPVGTQPAPAEQPVGTQPAPQLSQPAAARPAEQVTPTPPERISVVPAAPAARSAAAPAPPPAAAPPLPLPNMGEAPQPTATNAAQPGGADVDGARLIALNMALNGEPREQADRYLAENFQIEDRETLLDEVYAAIEG
jgi:hypothetical protein